MGRLMSQQTTTRTTTGMRPEEKAFFQTLGERSQLPRSQQRFASQMLDTVLQQAER